MISLRVESLIQMCSTPCERVMKTRYTHKPLKAVTGLRTLFHSNTCLIIKRSMYLRGHSLHFILDLKLTSFMATAIR